MNQKTLFLFVVVLLILGFFSTVMFYRSDQASAPGPARAAAIMERETAASKGASDARVTIVEFFDPACGTCAQFYPLVNDIVQQSGGRVRLLARYAPLHPGSEQVVRMLEAARLQGQFWPALEVLFANQSRWVVNHRSNPERARAVLNSIPLDHARLDADMNSPAVVAAVEHDVSDLESLGVRATPEFFVNGKPLPSFGYRQLEQLVSEAIADNY